MVVLVTIVKYVQRESSMKDELKQKLEFLISCIDYHLKDAWIDQTTIETILHNVMSDYAVVFHDLQFVPLTLKQGKKP